MQSNDRCNLMIAFMIMMFIFVSLFGEKNEQIDATVTVDSLHECVDEETIRSIIRTEMAAYMAECEAEPVAPPDYCEVSESSGISYTWDEIEYLAQLTIAEAGNQPELGQRLVIDTVLNRVEHPAFPDTITEVINQKNQFSPVTSGVINRYSSTDKLEQMILEEIERRSDSEVIFFRAYEYGPYGVPLYKLGGHYFSSYD